MGFCECHLFVSIHQPDVTALSSIINLESLTNFLILNMFITGSHAGTAFTQRIKMEKATEAYKRCEFCHEGAYIPGTPSTC